jgi:hypothetical protein
MGWARRETDHLFGSGAMELRNSQQLVGGPHEHLRYAGRGDPDVAEPVIGCAFARPVGPSGLLIQKAAVSLCLACLACHFGPGPRM